MNFISNSPRCADFPSGNQEAHSKDRGAVAETPKNFRLSPRFYGRAYPSEDFDRGGRICFFDNFHDIMPGREIAGELSRRQAQSGKMSAGPGAPFSTVRSGKLRRTSRRRGRAFQLPCLTRCPGRAMKSWRLRFSYQVLWQRLKLSILPESRCLPRC